MAEPIQGFRLSVQQRRLWHLSRAGHSGYAQAVIGLSGPLDGDRLARAIGQVVRRHDILRTRLHRVSGLFYPLQVVGEEARFDLRTVDGDRAGLAAIRQDERAVPEDGCPWRAVLVRTGDSKSYLVLTLPAWSADAASLATLATQLGMAYAGRYVDPDPVQYAEFADWQHTILETRDPDTTAFWRGVTGRVHSLAVAPFGTPRSPGSVGSPARGLSAATPIRLPEEMLAAVATTARSAGVPAATVLLGCWAAVVLRHQQATECTLAAGLDGRPSTELATSIGPFSRRVPVPVSLSGDTVLHDVIAQVAHSVVRGEPLLDGYRPAEPPVLLPVGFETVRWPADQVYDELAVTVESLDVDAEAEQLVLRYQPDQADQLELRYDPTVLDSAAVAAVADQLRTVIATLTEQPVPVRRLDLSSVDSRRLVDTVNRTAVARGPAAPLDRFTDWVRRAPENIAVADEDATLNYASLDARAGAIQRALSVRGVGPETRVALLHPHTCDLLAAVLGILRAGAAFVPVDPAWPAERQHAVLRDCGATIVVTDHAPGYPVDLPVIATTGLTGSADPAADDRTTGHPVVRPTPDNLAYLMYTSGSTGTPKGVAVTRRGLDNYLAWCAREYRLAGGSLVHTSVAFDLTLTGLLGPLLVGGTVHLATPGFEGLARAMHRGDRYGVVKLTPSHLELLARLEPDDRAAALAADLVIGGEALTEQTLSAWRCHAPDTRLINEYGPTETVVGCTTYTAVQPSSRPSVPIGRPIDNTQTYLLDANLRLVGLGMVGELYVGGAGVARGYHGRPDLTAERFVPDPFGDEPGGRLYRTGDLARYLPTGDLEYVGRVDDQIQLHGFRVEPGDVEAALVGHPDVGSAAVVARDGRLLGYVTAGAGRAVDPVELRRYLANRLPGYLVPAAVTVLPALPVTGNGKVDRAALPAPRASDGGGSAGSRGATAAAGLAGGPEAVIAEVWREALGVADVGRHDNFFDLGAHSFLLVEVAARLQQRLGREVSIVTLFEHPTVSALARAITGGAGPAPGGRTEHAPEHLEHPTEPEDRAARRRAATRRLGDRRQGQEHEH